VDEVEVLFPNLAVTPYRSTSKKDVAYNCIAHAAGDKSRFWWPVSAPGGAKAYWPDGAPKQATVEAFVKAFETLGYTKCADGGLEPDVEKVAIYALNGQPKHAARQLPSGSWSSKLGKNIDIEHSLAGLNGTRYGLVVAFVSRPRAAKKTPATKRKK
jgi:hypothetical protein